MRANSIDDMFERLFGSPYGIGESFNLPQREPCKNGKHKMIPVRNYTQKVEFPNKYGTMITGFRAIGISRCEICDMEEDFVVLKR